MTNGRHLRESFWRVAIKVGRNLYEMIEAKIEFIAPAEFCYGSL